LVDEDFESGDVHRGERKRPQPPGRCGAAPLAGCREAATIR